LRSRAHGGRGLGDKAAASANQRDRAHPLQLIVGVPNRIEVDLQRNRDFTHGRHLIAVRAGRLFDSKTGRMLARQVVVISGERIVDIGAEPQIKIPPGAEILDLTQLTVLPGLIDAHTHMFNTRKPKGSTEDYMLVAVQNAQFDLNAGFTAAREGGNARVEHRRRTAWWSSR